MTAALAPTAFTQVWMALAVRELERSGPLDDGPAMAEALRLHTGAQERLRARAWLLGQRLGLDVCMAQWRAAAWLLGAALAVAVLVLANGIVFAMLSQARSINAGSAFVAALGVHGLSLLLWLGSLLLAPRLPGLGGVSLGRLLLQGLARWPLAQRPQALALLAGARALLQSTGLAPWAFGLVSHLVWAASFVLVLLALLLAFAFHQYQLSWESTLFSPASFDTLVRVTGWLPGLLGFAVPQGAAFLPAQAEVGAFAVPARAGALWLMGCVLVYGLVPRLLCAALCALVWQRRQGRVALDTAQPYFRQLLARFAALQPSRVSDPEQRAPSAAPAPALPVGSYQPVLALVGFELAQAIDWPAQPLAAQAALVECIAGSMEERSAVLAALAQLRPQALVLVCNGAATPDRGTGRFLRDACRHAEHCALWLTSPAPGAAPPQRWHDWLDTLDGPPLARLHDISEAQAWAAAHHDRAP